MSQYNNIDPSKICNEESLKKDGKDCGGEDFCECVYILKVDVNDVVEFVLIDEGFAYDVSHPFHLHGMNFFVVGMERRVANMSHEGAAPFKGKHKS